MQSKIQNYFGGSSSNITERFDKESLLLFVFKYITILTLSF